MRGRLNRLLLCEIASTLFILNSNPVFSHEFWLEPIECNAGVTDNLRANVYVGEHFKGNSYPFIDRGYRSARVISLKKQATVRSTFGIDPAIEQQNLGNGLNIFAVQSGYSKLEYDSFELFATFVRKFDRPELADMHLSRGFEKDDVQEIYARSAKLLVNVGEKGGKDRITGLDLEWVALDNPFLSSKSGTRFQLLKKGKPMPNMATYLYSKSRGNDDQAPLKLKTDQNGIVTITSAKNKLHMLSAVLIRQPTEKLAKRYTAAWESLWASTVFCG